MTGDNITYKYISETAPKDKIDYSYSIYFGLDFIKSWLNTRNNFSKNKKEDLKFECFSELNKIDWNSNYISSKKIFNYWLVCVEEGKKIDPLIYLLVKRFEVTRKIYNEYSELMRPEDKTNFEDFESYALFGILLGKLFKKTKFYPFLNALLKLNDILLGIVPNAKENKDLVTISINLEKNIIIGILKEKNIHE